MDDDGSAQNIANEEITSKIVLTAIIVLFVAVLFVLLLHLYAKLFWWRVDQQQQASASPPRPPPSTRRSRRRFVFLPGQGLSLTSGLNPSILRSLPVVVFRQEDFKDGLECAVCLSELVNGDKARLLPKCNHGFHIDCIDMWFQSHPTCPICRNTVLGPEQAVSDPVESVSDNAATVNINNHSFQPQNQNPVSGFSSESPNFPTNVLVWGNHNQVTTGNITVAPSEDDANAGSSRTQDGVVLEINDVEANTGENISSSSSSIRFLVEEEESKSPVTTRLRSLKRFLSRENRVACTTCCSSSNAASSEA